VKSLHIIYASTSGHTEYVVNEALKIWQAKGLSVEVQQAELVKPEDFARGDVLVLGSGSWNTGGVEGQMNPYMHELLLGRAKAVDLGGRPVLLIALGDDRYFYTARSGEYMRQFVLTHNGKLLDPALMIINEPYGQESKVQRWAEAVFHKLSE
jgi:flavodoxin I